MPDARLVAACSVALTVTLVAIFSLRPLAPRLGLIDRPDARKCHKGRIPLIGGICFFLGLVAGLSYLDVIDAFIVALLGSGGLILLTGMIDDLYDLSVGSRLAIQAGTVLVVAATTGVYIDSAGSVLGNSELKLHLFGIPLTVVAIVGLMNAFNMLDGIDGLAGSLAVVAILAVLAFGNGAGWQAVSVLMLLQLLMVALVPYLGVNLGWPDGRKIFMGDAGSTLLGFLLGWGLVHLSQSRVAHISPVDVLWCVAIPVMDTLGVMVRRLRIGKSPFKPDRQHLHHLLLDAGCSPRATLAIIVGAGAMLASVGYALRALPDLLNLIAFLGILALYVARLPAMLQWFAARRPEAQVATGAVAAAFGPDGVIAPDPTQVLLAARDARIGQVRTLCILGESQDAVRIAPVARQLCHDDRFQTHVCVIGLSSEKQRRILELFDLNPDIDLGIASLDTDPSDITSATLDGIKRVLIDLKPDVVLVHGDTPATLAATLAACYRQIPVARLESAADAMHISLESPGERINRRVASALASFHFITRESSSRELIASGIPRDRIKFTGDTAVEALRTAIERIRDDDATEQALRERFGFLRDGSPLLLVTHREHIAGFAQLGRALRKVARARPDVDIVYPIALTPDAQRNTQRLGWRPSNVHLVEPLDYLAFAWLMQRAHIVLTGSAEVEAEAASLSKPVLVLRDAGMAADPTDPRLLEVEDGAIAQGLMTLLSDPDAWEALRAACSDAQADSEVPSFRIVDALAAVPSRSSALAA